MLSVYAREVLELHPVWRFRGTSGPGDAGQPGSEPLATEALPLPSERIHCWSVSLSDSPVSAALGEAMQRAAALALAPAEPRSLHWEDHLLPEDEGKATAALSGAGTEGPLSLQALQGWLVARLADPRSGAHPTVVLVWGAAFSGPVVADSLEGVWLLGLPRPNQFGTAEGRRQTWAHLLALRRLLL